METSALIDRLRSVLPKEQHYRVTPGSTSIRWLSIDYIKAPEINWRFINDAAAGSANSCTGCVGFVDEAHRRRRFCEMLPACGNEHHVFIRATEEAVDNYITRRVLHKLEN